MKNTICTCIPPLHDGRCALAGEPLALDNCDKCGKETDELSFVERDGYGFLCQECRFAASLRACSQREGM